MTLFVSLSNSSCRSSVTLVLNVPLAPYSINLSSCLLVCKNAFIAFSMHGILDLCFLYVCVCVGTIWEGIGDAVLWKEVCH